VANKNKGVGTTWETAATDYLNEAGLNARRTGSAEMGSGDIHAGEWTIEAKAEKVIDLPGYLKQLREEIERTGRPACKSVAMVKNRRHSTGAGYAVMSIENYRALMVYVASMEILLEDTLAAVVEMQRA
jgi:hypothetical protein